MLDVVINNADRKGGHILHAPDGRVLGVDHGVSLNTDDKLRTVLWGWIGDPLPDEAVDRLSELRALLEGDLAAELAEHILNAHPVVARGDQQPLCGVEDLVAPRRVRVLVDRPGQRQSPH